MANMTAERVRQILSWLEDHKVMTDTYRTTIEEEDWIAFKLSCTREQARRFIEQARYRGVKA